MAKRLSQMDRAIADVESKIATVKAEQEKRVEHFKLALETLTACRALLVSMKVDKKTETTRKPRVVRAPESAA